VDWASLVEFFDLISFFAIASLFAWLVYAPLQGQLILNLDATKQNQERARQNLLTITDYFLISFSFYCIAAVADYLANILPTLYRLGFIIIVGAAFVFGTTTLAVPIMYIRTIGRRRGKAGKQARDMASITPPPFTLTIEVTYIAAFQTAFSTILIYTFSTLVAKILLGVFVLVSYYGTIRLLKYWGTVTRRANSLNVTLASAAFWADLISLILFTSLHIPL